LRLKPPEVRSSQKFPVFTHGGCQKNVHLFRQGSVEFPRLVPWRDGRQPNANLFSLSPREVSVVRKLSQVSSQPLLIGSGSGFAGKPFTDERYDECWQYGGTSIGPGPGDGSEPGSNPIPLGLISTLRWFLVGCIPDDTNVSESADQVRDRQPSI